MQNPFKWAVLAALGVACAAAQAGTCKIPLAEGWRFVKQDDPAFAARPPSIDEMSATLDGACQTTKRRDAASPSFARCDFDDSAWRVVSVPHDWGVDGGVYDGELPYGDAFLPVTGVGWYRLRFPRPKSEVPSPKSKVFFECDGAMSFAHVWINGRFVGGWPYGYTRFRLDLTPYLDAGDNVLAIRCHNVADSSRWYTGGGLFRACRLLVLSEDHVVPGSVHITTPSVTAERAVVRVVYETSKSGRKERTFEVPKPHLWDVDDPFLYTVDVEGDAYRYGIRTTAWHADARGFMLNGRHVPLQGVCLHHDYGALGAAWNRDAERRRLLLLKEAGVNAIRSSHNPPDEGLLELCDELGLLVKDEVFDVWRHIGDAGKRTNGYHRIFEKWHERDVRAWVRTDRNHPCVILYSLGNEICDGKEKLAPHAEYVATTRRLAQIVREEDPTRPTCTANNNPANFTNDYPAVQSVMGCNYFSWQYPALRAAHPGVPFFGSETICMGSTRGEYHFPVIQRGPRAAEALDFHCSSYCWGGAGWNGKLGEGWAVPPDVQWHWMDKVGTAAGEFVWTGFDYLGGPYWCEDLRRHPHFSDPAEQKRAEDEVRRFGRTRKAIHSCDTGFFDSAGFKKDAFWLFQSRWRPDLPMAHVLPHWTWPGREGQVTPVHVFTSGDEGELFLNGKSLGRVKKQPGVWDRACRLRWDDVVYAPGTLEAVVYRNGKEWARDKVQTAGAPARLALSATNFEPRTTSREPRATTRLRFVDVAVLDAKGVVVPRAAVPVVFEVRGPGELVATDNGDEADMAPFHGNARTTFNGRALAIVRVKRRSSSAAEPTAEKSPVVLVARAKGLPPAEIELAAP